MVVGHAGGGDHRGPPCPTRTSSSSASVVVRTRRPCVHVHVVDVDDVDDLLIVVGVVMGDGIQSKSMWYMGKRTD
jgi:hypothetical protein